MIAVLVMVALSLVGLLICVYCLNKRYIILYKRQERIESRANVAREHADLALRKSLRACSVADRMDDYLGRVDDGSVGNATSAAMSQLQVLDAGVSGLLNYLGLRLTRVNGVITVTEITSAIKIGPMQAICRLEDRVKSLECLAADLQQAARGRETEGT